MKDIFRRTYSYVIPLICIMTLIGLRLTKNFKIECVAEAELFSDMLTATITFLSIVISVFGFLIPSLITVKNDAMVKYFLNHADVDDFACQIKRVVISGLIGIVFSVTLYLHDMISTSVMSVLLLVWIWIIIFFICGAYRFICILISLLIQTKEEDTKEIYNKPSDKRINEIKENIRRSKN